MHGHQPQNKKGKTYKIHDLLNLLAFFCVRTLLDPDEHFFRVTRHPRSPDVLIDHIWQNFHGKNNTLRYQLTSKRRTHLLVQRLSQTPHLLSKYNAIMADQLQHGFIERVQTTNLSTSTHYIPHLAVQKAW